jgi:mitosis inhibitor protein kinase SWE1
MPKKAPGTPVKKARVSYFGHERPWQSAVAHKVGLKDEVGFKKVPRKSLPAVFPPMGGTVVRANKSSMDWQPTDTEDEEEYSPSTRRDRYPGIGLGQPNPTQLMGKPDASLMWSRWPGILRRSSSGAFSSGSESASLANTPTRVRETGNIFSSIGVV